MMQLSKTISTSPFIQPTMLRCGQQTTLAKRVSCGGTGVHSGKSTRLSVSPAPVDHGIVFRRTDVDPGCSLIPASWRAVSSTRLSTTIANEYGESISTIEHLMSALCGLGVDNARVEVEGPEVPIMDGSAAYFVDLLERATLKEQRLPRKVIVITSEVSVHNEGRWARLEPSKTRSFSFACLFEKPVSLKDQFYTFHLTPQSFCEEIATARTFGFIEEVEMLKSMGYARGASLENAVGLTSSGVMNPEGLRFEDECVRHKILDAIGDLALAGYPIYGAYHASGSGHGLNFQLVKKLMSSPESYRIMEEGKTEARSFAAHYTS